MFGSGALLGLSCFRALKGLFHYNCHAHPRVDAALKVMDALRKTGDLELAALQDARSAYGNTRKTRRTLGSHIFSPIERRYEPASKMRNFRESVGFAALVYRDDRGSFVHR